MPEKTITLLVEKVPVFVYEKMGFTLTYMTSLIVKLCGDIEGKMVNRAVTV